MNKKIRVVIADDDPFLLTVHSDYLENKGNFDVMGTAKDGSEAVKMVVKLNPDLLILDYQMPNVDGLVALKEIRKRKLPVRVILTSGEDLSKRWVSAGADAFYPKGQPLTGLITLINQVLRPREEREAEAVAAGKD
jgi:DNA-binding NarL/FixJ family response regulator